MNLEGELAEQVDDRAKNLGDNVGERGRNQTRHSVRDLLQNIGQKHTRTPISRTSHMAGNTPARRWADPAGQAAIVDGHASDGRANKLPTTYAIKICYIRNGRAHFLTADIRGTYGRVRI